MVKEWSKKIEEKRDEANQDYKKMIDGMRNKIIEDIKNDYSQDELERKLEEYIDENILDENVNGLTVDDFLKINAFKILRENVGSHYNSIEDMDVKAWEKITKEYKVEPLFNKLKERIKEIIHG